MSRLLTSCSVSGVTSEVTVLAGVTVNISCSGDRAGGQNVQLRTPSATSGVASSADPASVLDSRSGPGVHPVSTVGVFWSGSGPGVHPVSTVGVFWSRSGPGVHPVSTVGVFWSGSGPGVHPVSTVWVFWSGSGPGVHPVSTVGVFWSGSGPGVHPFSTVGVFWSGSGPGVHPVSTVGVFWSGSGPGVHPVYTVGVFWSGSKPDRILAWSKRTKHNHRPFLHTAIELRGSVETQLENQAVCSVYCICCDRDGESSSV